MNRHGEALKSLDIFTYCSQRLMHMQIASVPWEAEKKNSSVLPAGKKHVAVFGCMDGESSDDSLVDLVSAEGWATAEPPKHCFYRELVFQRNTGFGGESPVTFYETGLPPPFCEELNFDLLKRRKMEVPGEMMSTLN